MKNFFLAVVVLALLLAGAVWWSNSLSSSANPDDSSVLSRSGIHWHPFLSIIVNGESVPIPANVGITGVVTHPADIHTHDGTGKLHIELDGRVTEDDTRLGNFFRTWGKDFMEFGSQVIMTVNGEGNTELENYPMKDGDLIELRYE
jgi:hypothetical protein